MPSVWPNASSGRPGSIPTEGHRLRPRATRPVRTCGCYWRTSDLKQEPEEVPHTEHELVLERVCDRCRQGLGQSVRAGEQPGGKRVSKVWGVPARSSAVTELAEHLLAEGEGMPRSRSHHSRIAPPTTQPASPTHSHAPQPRWRRLHDRSRSDIRRRTHQTAHQ
jgi:hypothetical protein